MSAAGADRRPGGRPYRHTQRNPRLAALVASVGVASVAATALAPMPRSVPWPVYALLALGAGVVLAVAYVFSALTVAVDAEALRWEFRRGVFRRSVPRAEIAAAAAARTTLADGVGVHGWSRRMVYNVALGPAVRVERRDGRAVVLGTDDPGGLLAALGPPAA